MDIERVEFHNAAEVRDITGYEGVRPQRVPEDVRLAVNEDARCRLLSPTNCELRFVPKDETVTVTLSAPCGAVEVQPFWGPYQGDPFVVQGDADAYEITRPEKLDRLDAGDHGDFSPQVCRLICRGISGFRGEWILYHGVEGAVRPPRASEIPDRRYLAYGTSITEGGAASGIHLTYASQTARRVRADLLNLGCAGSAFCEPAMADHIADRDGWDVATLALSVNMLEFDDETFRERVGYMVDTVAAENPEKPVVAITIFPVEFEADAAATAERFRTILREEVADAGHDNLSLLEGTELMDATGLSTDDVHPADAGHAQIADGLSAHLRELL